ncbi:MAG: class I SAM-dependent methyltransferase [Chloroflexota bacterium]
MRLDRIRRVYDERARRYDATIGRAEAMMLGDFRRQFGALMTGATLEVGVGSGLNLPHYPAGAGPHAAIDLSAGMLEVARERAATLGLAVLFAQGDAQRLPFPDATFDTVGVSLALCTIPDPERALREMRRVCRPAGKVVLLEHVLSPLWPVALLERAMTPLQARAIGCHLDRKTLETARAAGLRIESEQSRRLGVFRLAVARP